MRGLFRLGAYNKYSMPTDFVVYAQRLCAKLQAKLTLRYAKVSNFGGFAPELD